MSQNVDVVARAIAAVNARDIAGYLACCAHDVALETPMSDLGGSYHGLEDIRRFFGDIEDAAPDFELQIRGIEAVGSACVVVDVHVQSTGRASGLQIAVETANLYELSEGKIRRVRVFPVRSAAIEAAQADG